LKEGNSSLNHVVKTTVYLSSMKDYPIVNAEYAKFFGNHKPARVCVAVLDLPLKGLLIPKFLSVFKLKLKSMQ